jgi:hypothetical protein
MECVQLHLQSIFRYDAAEMQRLYISNGLKKPNRVPIWDFVRRVECLNGYLTLLPCLYYSSRGAKSTKVVRFFDDPDLASHILRMVPWNWQDQCELTGAMVPQSIRELLEALERNERAFPTDMVGDGPKTTAKSSDSSKRKMVSFDDRIPKNVTGRRIACFVKSMGSHTPPTILWTTGSTFQQNHKEELQREKSNGTSHGPERPSQGGSS